MTSQSFIVKTGPNVSAVVAKLRPGEVAVIDHQDLDGQSAMNLIAAGATAVLNVATASTGRYPNMGPARLLEAGVTLIDECGSDLMRLQDQDEITIDGGTLRHNGNIIAEGRVFDQQLIDEILEKSGAGLAVQLETLAANTAAHLAGDPQLFQDPQGALPALEELKDRHVLVVTKSHDYARELNALKHYRREFRPKIIAVGPIIGELKKFGYKPDFVIGTAAELLDEKIDRRTSVVLVRSESERQTRLSGKLAERNPRFIDHSGPSAQIALLTAYASGAQAIIWAGHPNTMPSFLDQGQSSLAFSFLTQLRLEDKLLPAASVTLLYRRKISGWLLVLLLLVALGTVVVAVWNTASGTNLYLLLMDWWANVFSR